MNKLLRRAAYLRIILTQIKDYEKWRDIDIKQNRVYWHRIVVKMRAECKQQGICITKTADLALCETVDESNRGNIYLSHILYAVYESIK